MISVAPVASRPGLSTGLLLPRHPPYHRLCTSRGPFLACRLTLDFAPPCMHARCIPRTLAPCSDDRYLQLLRPRRWAPCLVLRGTCIVRRMRDSAAQDYTPKTLESTPGGHPAACCVARALLDACVTVLHRTMHQRHGKHARSHRQRGNVLRMVPAHLFEFVLCRTVCVK